MNTKRTWQSIAGAALLIAAVVGASLFINHTRAPALHTQLEQPASISLTVQGLYQSKQVSVSENETVLHMLQTLNTQDPQLALSTKEYAGLGTLVDSMDGMKNGTDKKYWQYKVNGVMPQIGADGYKLKNGDSVEWIFGASQE